jgi:GNAT superfamily N-acetyltransferase
MKKQLSKLLKYYETHGLLELLKLLLYRCGLKFYTRTVICLEINIDLLPPSAGTPYSFEIASEEDVRNHTEYYDGWYRKEDAIRRIRDGSLLFVLKKDGRMIYFVWAEMKRARQPWLDLVFNLPPDTVYGTASYTVPEYRNRGIARKIDLEVMYYLKERGVKRVLGTVDHLNAASREVNKKFGAREYQMVRYRRLWFVKHYRVTSIATGECRIFLTLWKNQRSLWDVYR